MFGSFLNLIYFGQNCNPESPNKPLPTLLYAVTWALHTGLSSNFRYQALNGVEFVLAKVIPAAMFKSAVVVLSGMSFVALAGSQIVAGNGTVSVGLIEEKEKWWLVWWKGSLVVISRLDQGVIYSLFLTLCCLIVFFVYLSSGLEVGNKADDDDDDNDDG